MFKWGEQSDLDFFYELSKWFETYDRNYIFNGGSCNFCKYCCLKQSGPNFKLIKKELISIEKFEELIKFFINVNKNKTYSFINAASINKDRTIFLNCELFEHPMVEDLLKIILKYLKNYTVRFESTLGRLDKKYYNLLDKLPNLEIGVNLNFLDETERDLYINSKTGSSEEIDNLIDFSNHFYDKIYSIYIKYLNLSDSVISNVNDIIKSKLTKLTNSNLCFSRIYYTKYSSKFMKDSIIKHSNFKRRIEVINLFCKNLKEFKYIQFVPDGIQSMNDLMKLQDYTEVFKYTNEKFKSSIECSLMHVKELRIPLNKVAYLVADSILKLALEEYPKLNWLYVKNIYYGGNITAFELLSYKDIYKVIKENSEFDIYIGPRAMQNNSGLDSLGNNYNEIFKEVNLKLF